MPRTAAILHPLIPHPPRPYVLPIQAISQPVSFPTPNSIRARFKGGDSSTGGTSSGVKGHPFQEWKGSSTQDHAVNRVSQRDTTDPETAAAQQGEAERAENEGIADATKSGATTERDLRQNKLKAKKEHPHAPEPIIGMNDEKGESEGS
ncbi:hypothetical protein PISL3812_06625 [Talaromyces islandicus]|uniref:Uncharacterized protein n=1 Tax=Talaromyces islandicus TaxID=28573 RepID=A0A0U1M1X9_TALIS|nr:hypothetical protein PISL3812_06625 [Talaromyces islandicus]